MSGKLLIASLTLFAASAASAAESDLNSTGEWVRETRHLPKATIDVYHRTPYALTGRMAEPSRTAGEWVRETRYLPKVTIDVYRR